MAEAEKMDDAGMSQAEKDAAAAKQAEEAIYAQYDQDMAKKAADAAAAESVKHVWTSEDTYASLAQKYYGSFQEPYWRLIYEFNKAIIGNHPNNIRVGLEILIPPLPPELKK
jgi:nucleoid-associated protein YgaU